MNKSKGAFREIFNLQTLLLLVLGGAIAGLWFYLESLQEEGNYPGQLVAVLWVLMLIFSLWIGNLGINNLLRRKYAWEEKFNIRFLLQLVIMLVYSLACINVSYILFKNHFTELPPTPDQLTLLNIYGTLFLIPVISIQFGLLFLHKWKRAVVEQEKLRREQVQSELITLRSHLSPHFLFNSLNILSSLIHSDNHDAQDYLDRFAEVYRYVLRNGEVELIGLNEELQFIEAYIHLLRQRFTNSMQIKIDIDPGLGNYKIPPMAIQMVVENALKHNRLSEHHPLLVEIQSIETPAIVVTNNLMPRKVPDHEKTGLGLENISRRYQLSVHQDIQIIKNQNTFTVTLPLIPA